MATAKDIIVKPITSQLARQVVQRYHYSGKVVNNSQLHFGVYLDDKIHGAMQFGPSLDKRKIQGLVRDTQWHEFIELNRMAFDDVLPRNSESRAISVAINLIRKHAPQIKWIISFADATQCGDGTIYRASGFVLTGIKENVSQWVFDIDYLQKSSDWRHKLMHDILTNKKSNTLNEMYFRSEAWSDKQLRISGVYTSLGKQGFMDFMKAISGVGFQLRYIYFVDKSYREKLTVPEIPFSRIKEMGAAMYKGEKVAD